MFFCPEYFTFAIVLIQKCIIFILLKSYLFSPKQKLVTESRRLNIHLFHRIRKAQGCPFVLLRKSFISFHNFEIHNFKTLVLSNMTQNCLFIVLIVSLYPDSLRFSKLWRCPYIMLRELALHFRINYISIKTSIDPYW